jgi:hypothetical protein
MRFIDSKTHGFLDYAGGVLFIASPWLFNFSDIESAKMVPIIIGIMVIGMSLFTDYELGAFRTIPLSIHLTIDIISGLFLLASPWIFDFADRVFWPHVILGLIEISAGLFTVRKVSTSTQQV